VGRSCSGAVSACDPANRAAAGAPPAVLAAGARQIATRTDTAGLPAACAGSRVLVII